MAEILWIFLAIALALLIGAAALTEVADDIGADEPDGTDEHATDPGESEPYTLATGWHDPPHMTTIADDEQHG